MTWEYVLFSKEDGIGTITLNRPDAMNALGGGMRQEILAALETASADSEVKVIVITGAGKAFCAGGDIKEFVSGKTRAEATLRMDQRPTRDKAVLLIQSTGKPVIASVNGVAAGGGCNLALACDMRIASDRARFGETFVRRGIHPYWGGVWFLPRLVGYAKAAELIFSGEVIDAQEALRIGLVNKVVPHEELPAATKEFAMKFLKSAPIPVALAKKALQNYSRIDLPQALDNERLAQSICWNTEDREEGMNSFLEKREPVFKGK
ncbi:MAG TPA: enoyl-CoA hydratase/isomerase family protein [Thermodesulfobacteriota bacterium]|nr:enoyl-CoA hydratase/isomerase family protein [Thermodesulfobacteriota bacterium]